ncbi:Mov34/MPN/PAD-1 family protein [Sinorhizobium americanum]
MRMQPLVWLPRPVVHEMHLDADKWYDDETGGTFMGYWADSNVAVVTASIPGGPHAHRARYSFVPDQEWQQSEIGRHYLQSARLDTYLGDWHTHPNAACGSLSCKDRACLRKIVNTPSARNVTPIMILMCGNRQSWNLHAWVARLRRPFIFYDQLIAAEAVVQFYG